MKTHYARRISYMTTCGQVAQKVSWTNKKHDVTCLTCRGTHTWKADLYGGNE